jgi:hypothetical protein
MPMNYQNTEALHQHGGRKTVRKVNIKNGKGYKSVTKYHRKRRIGTVRMPIRPSDVALIMARKFIPGLFSDCKLKSTQKRR